MPGLVLTSPSGSSYKWLMYRAGIGPIQTLFTPQIIIACDARQLYSHRRYRLQSWNAPGNRSTLVTQQAPMFTSKFTHFLNSSGIPFHFLPCEVAEECWLGYSDSKLRLDGDASRRWLPNPLHVCVSSCIWLHTKLWTHACLNSQRPCRHHCCHCSGPPRLPLPSDPQAPATIQHVKL